MYTCIWCGRKYHSDRSIAFCGLKCESEFTAANPPKPSSGDNDGCGWFPAILLFGGIGTAIVVASINQIINAKWKWNEIIAFVAIGVIVLVGLCKIVAILGEKDTDDPG